jgi:glutamate--cysteine ligase
VSKAANKSKRIVRNLQDLSGWLEAGSTPKHNLVIGSEHEKLLLKESNQRAASFNGKKGIEKLLEKLQDKGWAAVTENGRIIELTRDNANVSLEPSGQMEHSTPIYSQLHQVANEIDRQIDEVVEVGRELGIDCIGLGYHPVQNYQNLPRIPKSRYKSYEKHMREMDGPEKKAMQMLYASASTQVNMGFINEQDMVKKLRVSLALQPIVSALCANSPFKNGKPSGYQSTRSHVVHNAVNGRYGFMLPVAFEKDFGFERYAEYALNEMPLMGVYKNGYFKGTHDAKFSDLMAGELDVCPGKKATMNDWENHLNCIWPEVRLRQFLEMRGADSGPVEMIKALPALWIGLMYDDAMLDHAYEMVRHWSAEDREYLREQTPVTGLQTPFLGGTVQDVALNVLALSDQGLNNRNILDDHGRNEAQYLEPLHEIANSGLNWADRLIQKYNTEWKQDIAKVFNEMSYRQAPSVLSSPSAAQRIPPKPGP